MKNLLYLTLLLAPMAHADLKETLLGFEKVLSSDCNNCASTESFSPPIKKAEVKVSLPCEAQEKLALTSKETEQIDFYEPANASGGFPLSDAGLIVRSRTSQDDPSKRDVTVKFRPKSGELKVQKAMYDTLKARAATAEAQSPDAPAMEFKCEADVAYGVSQNNRGDSCSLTTLSSNLTTDHSDFIKLLDGQVSEMPTNDLSALRKISIAASGWKLDQVSFNTKLPTGVEPLKFKKVSVERWDINGACFLEVSAKVDATQIEASMKTLVTALKAQGFDPDAVPQGQKTKRAFAAAPAGWTKL